MNEHGEGTPHGIERIRAVRSLAEILEVASSFEATARDFYRGLIPKVSKRIRYLVEELAEEEQRHYDLFSALARRDDIHDQLTALVEVPASDTRFSDAIQAPSLGDQPDDQAILQYALGREQAAMDQYHALSASVEPGPIRDAFAFLANEETKHKLELEKMYYEVVHSGGV